MEAIRVQHAGHGGKSALLTRADSPLGDASSYPAGGTRVNRSVRHCAPFTEAAGRAKAEPVRIADSIGQAQGTTLSRAIDLVNAAAVAAPDTLAMADYLEAADYAALAEELSRTVDYLQILAAGAVDRTRTRAIAAAATTRLTRAAGPGTGAGSDSADWVTSRAGGTEILNETDAAWPAGSSEPSVPRSPADDGCRNTEEFLRIRLRIGITEARRRLRLAHEVLPATTLTGDRTPPARQHLAHALTPAPADADAAEDISAAGAGTTAPVVSSRAGTIITTTLDRLQHHTTPETLTRVEEHLTQTAASADPDFLARVARSWADTIDADGTEPSEEALRHTQGAFIRKPRHGLHHLEIFATTDQYEHLLTVMNTATNPRTHTPDRDTAPGPDSPDADPAHGPDLDRRTRSQKQLDGIITAVKAALTTNTLPTTGGNRPQIIATINCHDLLPHPGTTMATNTRTSTGTGNFAFTGPVAAATLRKIACDADIIPALLGTNNEILDLGRKTRLFTPTQRLALTARDQGCTFPNCTIPAPWCEAHHITYWSHGGTTDTNNGALLCSHHHHLIHKEQWTIQTIHGTPWYIPPPHIDPHQKPQQNHYFKPPPPPVE